MLDKSKKAQLILLVKERYAEAMLMEEQEELSPQTKPSIKAKPITAPKPANAEARAAIRELIKQAKR